jgi:hypothetical protein
VSVSLLPLQESSDSMVERLLMINLLSSIVAEFYLLQCSLLNYLSCKHLTLLMKPKASNDSPSQTLPIPNPLMHFAPNPSYAYQPSKPSQTKTPHGISNQPYPSWPIYSYPSSPIRYATHPNLKHHLPPDHPSQTHPRLLNSNQPTSQS